MANAASLAGSHQSRRRQFGQRSRIVRFVERGVCGDDWIEEPEGTSFPPRKLKLSTRTTARDRSFDVTPQTFAVATIRVWFVRNGNLAQRFGSISQASPYGELGLRPGRRVEGYHPEVVCGLTI
jgi:hypothetical protein